MTVAGSALIGIGSALLALAGIGIIKLPDIFSRMHAGTKASAFGLSLVLAGSALLLAEPLAGAKFALAIVFQLLTAPVAAHVIGRAAYLSGIPPWERTRHDELRDRLPGPEDPTPGGDDH